MQIESITRRKILISPLNWGFGHVSRCIGLIDRLLRQENDIYVACDPEQEIILRDYFADRVRYITHDGYPFEFKGKGKFATDLFRSLGKLNKRLKRELREVEGYVQDHQFDLIISDHRYGFRHEQVESIIITHQLNLPVRWYQGSIQRIHRNYLNAFSLVCVPDYEDHRLSGKLSQNNKVLKTAFWGPLSRFSIYEVNDFEKSRSVLIASGPEIYAQQFVDQFADSDMNIIASPNVRVPVGCKSFQGSWIEMDHVILQAKEITSRSGYSTIMDLEFLKVPSNLEPTPGQPEQEYLKTLHFPDK